MTFLFGVKDCVTSGTDDTSIMCVLFFVEGVRVRAPLFG